MQALSSQTILVVDQDLISYQILQNCFFADKVEVLWAKTKQQAIDVNVEIGVILCAIPLLEDDPYDLVAELGHRHPNAAMFMLPSNYDTYDSFQARNAGALGAFFKPLSFASLESRLEEFLDVRARAELESVNVPASTEQVAKLISYQTTGPEIEDIESIVKEVLPVVVEKVLRIQLQHNSILREIVEREVQEAIEQEVGSTIQRLLEKAEKKSE